MLGKLEAKGGYDPTSPRATLNGKFDSSAGNRQPPRLSPRFRDQADSKNRSNFYENLFNSNYSTNEMSFRSDSTGALAAAAAGRPGRNESLFNEKEKTHSSHRSDLSSILFGESSLSRTKPSFDHHHRHHETDRYNNNDTTDNYTNMTRHTKDYRDGYYDDGGHHRIRHDDDDNRNVIVNNEPIQPRGINKSFLMKMKHKYKYRISANVAGTKFEIVKEAIEAIGCKILSDENFDR